MTRRKVAGTTPTNESRTEHYAEFPYIWLEDAEQMRMVRAQAEGLTFLLDIYDELTEEMEDEI